jgi:hypothetical protein
MWLIALSCYAQKSTDSSFGGYGVVFYKYITVYGTVYATTFNGDGGSLSNLQSTNFMGVIDPSNLPTTLVYSGFGTPYYIGGVLLSNQTVTATTFNGNVVGNVTGNLTGNLTGHITGQLLTDSMYVTNNAEVGGNLMVDGNTTLGNVTVSGALTLPGGGAGVTTNYGIITNTLATDHGYRLYYTNGLLMKFTQY